ncbi:MAG: thiamine-phosphate kinase [Gammaproteobacteria bacterium]|nr:thiamine-phosphate kinase [Gammaproteobacteria bacterium]
MGCWISLHTRFVLTEFSIIEQYFKGATGKRDDVRVGIGDDGAVMRVPAGMELVVVMDTLVSGIHFFEDCNPADIAYKSLAVNLSDLAAMGAQPAWATLSLTRPTLDDIWLQSFVHGFSSLANEYNIQLIGGDLSRGPLSVTVQMHGFVPQGQALLRSGAAVGDAVFVTGSLGDAGLALRLMKNDRLDKKNGHHVYLQHRLQRPTAQVDAGMALRQIASSMIDISDGLVADLGHVLRASAVGARVDVDLLPVSMSYEAVVSELSGTIDQYQLALSAGDDYELCFTVAEDRIEALVQFFSGAGLSYHRIGVVEEGDDLRLLLQGNDYVLEHQGFRHF